ncbi:MAG: Tfp pilus assembly protein FimT/FimU [Gammaproteobacteria bacterium]
MPTSASCRRAEASPPAPPHPGLIPGKRVRGFTLLELTVVLALVSLLTAIVGPRLWGWVESARYRADIDRVGSALRAVPSATFFSGKPREIARAEDLGLALPEGWYLETSMPLRYAANGMSSGAVVSLKTGDRVIARWRVEAVSGEPIPLEETP